MRDSAMPRWKTFFCLRDARTGGVEREPGGCFNRLKFFLLAAHSATMIRLVFAIAVLATVAVAAQSQPPRAPDGSRRTAVRPRATNRTQPRPSDDNQQTVQPPTITVVVPEKSPEQLKAEATQREREIAIQ